MRLIFFLAIAFLAGCAGAPPADLPGAMGRGAEHAQRGARYYARGDYAQAADEFSKSLAAERSAENEAGIATASLNLALTLQRLERLPTAEQVVDAVLLDRALPYPSLSLAELATKKAQLRLEAKDFSAAQMWIGMAWEHCGRPCPQSTRLQNLSARHALEMGDPARAIAEVAAGNADASADPVERANGMRLRAAASLQLGQAASALVPLAEVLQMDKAAGDGRRILQDLQLLAACHAAMKQTGEERRYWLRALSVATGLGDEAAATGIRERLIGLPHQ